MIPVDEARERLAAALRPLPVESVSLQDALGRVLAEPVVADRDFPPTDRSAMDGFAVRSADLPSPGTLRVVAEVAAGTDPTGVEVGAGDACRVFTGAVIPHGADAVVMVERCEEDRDAGTVRVDDRPSAGQHIRHGGQDLAAGETVLSPGARIRPAEIAALASVGCVDVPVHRVPTVSVLSTGDEIVTPDREPAPHQVRNSNAAMLVAQVREAGYAAIDLGHAPDRPDELRQKLALGLESDLLLVTGGVSVGDYDLVPDTLAELGVETLFHGIAMKPGKPILAGRTRAGGVVLGLPGNPLSVFVGFKLFGESVLKAMSGIEDYWPRPRFVTLTGAIRRRPGRETYHLATIEGDEATPVSSTGSGDVLSLARGNALVVTEADASEAPAGATLRAFPF
jgi:molybdopterin molybdotransferase